MLRAAGWRVVTVDASTPLALAWQRLPRFADQAGGLAAAYGADPSLRMALMNPRLTWIAALAVFLSSFSLLTVIDGHRLAVRGLGRDRGRGRAPAWPPGSGAIPAAAVATVLTLIAVGPLLEGPGWPRRVGGLAIVAVVAASAGVRRVLPALAEPGHLPGGAAALPQPGVRPRARPSPGSCRPRTRCGSWPASPRRATPSTTTRRRCRASAGIELIAAAGIGLVAIITDLLAVRLRSPAVAGLPLLVLFAVPVATNVKNATVGLTLAFCLGITGYLAMLATDGRQRLRLWGRLVTVWEETTGRGRAGARTPGSWPRRDGASGWPRWRSPSSSR